MFGQYSLILFGIVTMVSMEDDLIFVSRDEWFARPPKLIESMSNPVPFVIIHHSYQPSACYQLDDCIKAMQWMQDLHQFNNSWNDIGYSFAVGSDGRVYEGRGWSRVGAHAPKFNNISIGICMIGDWRYQLPPLKQMETVKRLIKYGVDKEMIRDDYQLLGHRQVRDTECPGQSLFDEIQHWDHFDNAAVKEYGIDNNNLLIKKLHELNKN